MENKLGLFIIFLVFSGGLLLANNFFDFQKMLTGNMVSTGTINITILPRPGAEEPTIVTPTVSGGGGSTFGGEELISIDPKSIKILLKDIDIFKQPFKITNNNKNLLKLVFESNLKDIIIFSEERINLMPRESKSIELIFQSKPNTKKGVHTGKILIKNNGVVIKEISVIVEIETTQKLFDLTMNILPEYKTIKSSENLPVIITIFDIAGIGKSEVNLEYQIKDFSGNILNGLEENLTIENQMSFTKLINIPWNTKAGEYVVDVILRKGATVSTTSQVFTVSGELYEEKPLSNNNLSVILIILIIALFIATLVIISKFKRLAKNSKIHKKTHNFKIKRKV